MKYASKNFRFSIISKMPNNYIILLYVSKKQGILGQIQFHL